MNDYTQEVDVSKVRSLYQEERQVAYQRAKDAARADYGAAPERRNASEQNSKYPQWIKVIIVVSCLVVFAAAFTISSIRLYHIGRSTFYESIPSEQSAHIVGLAIIILAATTQVVATLAMAIAPNLQRLLQGIALLATAIEIVGNAAIGLPEHYGQIFAWLESFAPPLMVIGMAYVLKSLLLDSIEAHHAANQQHEHAMQEWLAKQALPPELHPEWKRFLVSSLHDAVRRANASLGRGYWSHVTEQQWVMLIQKELKQDMHELVFAAPVELEQKHSNGGGNGRTGEVANVEVKRASKGYSMECPRCKMKFTRPDELGAKRALSAHMRKHVAEQNGEQVAVSMNGNGVVHHD